LNEDSVHFLTKAWGFPVTQGSQKQCTQALSGIWPTAPLWMKRNPGCLLEIK
jgi:hypothetical protein